MSKSSHRSCSVRKRVLRNFAIFTGKHLCQSLFFNKVAGLRHEACNFVKKKTLAQVLSCEFCEISKNTFFTEHLRATASGSHSFICYHSFVYGFKHSCIYLVQQIISISSFYSFFVLKNLL